MPYKISGTKNTTARIIIFKESDWSIESNTIVSGSGNYEIEDLESGNKLVLARNNDGWVEGFGTVASVEYVPSGGDRGIFGGGTSAAVINTIEYIAISTTGNSQDFGDLTVERRESRATSNGITGRGLFGGGAITTAASFTNTIDYITILSPSDATDFGDLIIKRNTAAATSNGTNDRGVFGGGGISGGYVNIIDYVTISSPADSGDFGDLSSETGDGRRYTSATSNGTDESGVFLGGYTGTATKNVIDHITINSLGNASNVGDITVIRRRTAATSNLTNGRGVCAGGDVGGSPFNVIDYVTFASLGDATNFGDLTVDRYALAGFSNGTNERGCFVGGSTGSASDIIDYITISTTGNASDFGDVTSTIDEVAGTSNA